MNSFAGLERSKDGEYHDTQRHLHGHLHGADECGRELGQLEEKEVIMDMSVHQPGSNARQMDLSLLVSKNTLRDLAKAIMCVQDDMAEIGLGPVTRPHSLQSISSRHNSGDCSSTVEKRTRDDSFFFIEGAFIADPIGTPWTHTLTVFVKL